MKLRFDQNLSRYLVHQLAVEFPDSRHVIDVGLDQASDRASSDGRRRALLDWWLSVVEQPEQPHLRLFTVDDERLWESRPRLRAEDFALEDVTDEEWDAFYSALTDA